MRLKLRAGDVCRRLQDTLAEQGPAALRDDEAAQRHLEECGDCFGALEALAALDEGFGAMATIDAPDEVVASLLAREELQAAETPASPGKASGAAAGWSFRRLFVPGRPRLRAAVAFVMLAVIGLPAYFYLRPRQLEGAAGAGYQVGYLPGPDADRQNVKGSIDEAKLAAEENLRERLEALGYLGGAGGKAEPRNEPAPASPPARLDSVGLASLEARGAYDLPVWVGTESNVSFRGGSPRVESDVAGPFDDDSEARQRVRERLRERLKSLPRGLQEEESEVAMQTPERRKGSKDSRVSALELVERDASIPPSPPRELARRFLAERDAVDVRSRPATGYWANTYVPGDPALRFLQARLAGLDGSSLALAGNPPRPHDAARQVMQPFDPPPEAALAVQLQTDRAALEGETRLLVQVGLAGTPRRGGRRPAMNVALVLDPRAATPETGAAMVALAGAFAEAHDLGDRFRLIAAGPNGGELVAPEDLQRGSAVVAARDLLAAGATDSGATAPGPSLADAVRMAIEKVAGGDDPTAPLGSSAVILATSRTFGPELDELDKLIDLAHDTGLAGIPLSVVGIGGAVDLAELDELALAGQGSRRLLPVPAEARTLVDRELAAAGRAVARAVRLTVTLAPGVRLVDVVGSMPHAEKTVDWIRRTERAIDRRLARNLGIAADRGDDEAGIQIVIPTFYAGDRHAVLFDVIAPGPGPIADVTVRYKDLVRVENAIVRQRLELPQAAGGRGQARRGPLELNVLENLLAHRLRDALKAAGDSLAQGEAQAAALRLEVHRRLLAGLRAEVGGLRRDPGLSRDLVMLDEYLELLRGDWPGTPERQSYLADSLRYAARLKVLPVPEPLGGAS